MSLLKPGDVIFTAAQGEGLINRQVNWWTRTWGEPPSRASHVAVVLDLRDPVEDSYIIEQTFPNQQRSVLGKYWFKSDVYIFRRRGLLESSANSIVKRAESEIGKRYGVGKILLFLADAIIGKIVSLPIYLLGKLLGRKWRGIEFPIFSRLDITKDIVCSQMVAKYYWERGMHFGGHWLTQNPDSMIDHCTENPELWELVTSNE